ncbi:MAG: hypothetical protein ABFS56_28595 [Pseudomonadota bacterium]
MAWVIALCFESERRVRPTHKGIAHGKMVRRTHSTLAETHVPSCIAGEPTTLPIKLVSIQVPTFIPKTTLSADHYPWQTVDIPNSPQATTIFGVSPYLSLDENRIADFMNAVYEIQVGDTTHSPTWNETTLEQGLAYFKSLPGDYYWFAAQYFADKMK